MYSTFQESGVLRRVRMLMSLERSIRLIELSTARSRGSGNFSRSTMRLTGNPSLALYVSEAEACALSRENSVSDLSPDDVSQIRVLPARFEEPRAMIETEFPSRVIERSQYASFSVLPFR